MKKKIESIVTTTIILVLCVALTVAIIAKLIEPQAQTELRMNRTEEVSSSVNVYAEEIVPTDFYRTLKFYGSVVDSSDVISSISRTSGYVTEITVKEGDSVEEGQILGYIDPSSPGSSYQKSPIKAKVSGTIDEITVAVGEYLSSGSSFATIRKNPEYKIEIEVPEQYLDYIEIGTSADITSSTRSGISTKAYISDIATVINSSTRTVTVKLTPEDSIYMLDGLSVTAKLVIEKQEGVVVIPSDSISSIGGNNYVFVALDNIAEQREVSIGSQNDTESVILSGLDFGEYVIVDGKVSQGNSVNIVER